MRNFDDPAYKKARIDTLKRDGFCCKWPKCNSKKNLRVHHIQKWSTHPYLRYDLFNLITLCKAHHFLVTGKEDEFAVFLSSLIRKK